MISGLESKTNKIKERTERTDSPKSNGREERGTGGKRVRERRK